MVFFLFLEGEAEGGGLVDEHRAVGGVEPAEDEGGARRHLLFEGRHIGQEDVAVDVCQNQVESAFYLI